MCTVTVIPLPGGFRVACNRDESRSRAAALPPRVETLDGGIRAAMPTDPTGGGTWIAVSGRGLVSSLLNYNSTGNPSARPISRGRIIPTLLACNDVPAAARRVLSLDATHYGPFRLLVTDGNAFAEIVSDGATISSRESRLDGIPLLLTSSGLGDALVETPRRQLFDETLARLLTPAAQDAFHRHAWPDRRHLSVCMSRGDAKTVSYTTIEVAGGEAVMRYWPQPPDAIDGIEPTVCQIPWMHRS